MTMPSIDDALHVLIALYNAGFMVDDTGTRIDKRIDQLQRVILQRAAEHTAPSVQKKKRKKGGSNETTD